MAVALVKNGDRAALLGTEYRPDGVIDEIEWPLKPDDVVEGRKVADWPEGCHPISDAEAYRFVGPPRPIDS